jgi:PAS domain-containing protein
VLGRDGDLLWISESCTPVFDDSGTLLQYVGVVGNISARKQAEDALHTTYNLTRTTIDSLHDGILVTDLAGYLIMANSAAIVMLGQPVDDGELPSFFANLSSDNPFARFQKKFDPQAGMFFISPDRKPVHWSVVPYKNAMNEVIGAVHVLYSGTQSMPELAGAVP